MGSVGTILPAPGETWVKPSCPVPTVVVLSRHGQTLAVRDGRRRHELPVWLFLAQGFERSVEAAPHG